MIELSVDPQNPGEVFACYGLFEVSERGAPGSLGKFREGNTWKFELKTDVSLPDCIETLLNMKIKEVPESEFLNGMKAKWSIKWKGWAPVTLQTRWGGIHLNWWRVPTFDKESGLKFWAGQVSPASLLEEMKEELRSIPADDPFRPVGLNTCFGFDSRFTWSKRDVGFSLDHPRIKVSVSPFAEILSFIALQTFRPKILSGSIEYYLWRVDLPIIVARVACSGTIAGCVGYKSRIINRGKYKALTSGIRI